MEISEQVKKYISKKPKKAKAIKKAVAKGFQEYEETFKKLAAV